MIALTRATYSTRLEMPPNKEPIDIVVTIYPDVTPQFLERVEADEERMNNIGSLTSEYRYITAASRLSTAT